MSTKFKVDVSGTETEIARGAVRVKAEKGELTAHIRYSFLKLKRDGDKILIESEKDIDYQKAIAGTLAAEIRNMVEGVKKGYSAELELVYMHFPATLKVVGDKLVVENFVGERKAREIPLPKGVVVKVSGTKITINGIDKYLVGQTAGTIENKIQIKNKDRRVFKDGVFITKKP